MQSLFAGRGFHDENMLSQNRRNDVSNIEDFLYRQHTGKLIISVYEKSTGKSIQGAKVSN